LQVKYGDIAENARLPLTKNRESLYNNLNKNRNFKEKKEVVI